MAQIIIVHGPDGAGKSTQAKKLARHHNWEYLSTGDLCRSSRDLEVIKALQKGHLPPSAKIQSMLESAFNQLPVSATVVLDGFPRKLGELKWLDGLFKDGRHHLKQLIILNVPEEVSRQRLEQRGRASDTPRAINNRMDWFQKQALPVIEELRRRGDVTEIDGSLTEVEVFKQLEAAACAHS